MWESFSKRHHLTPNQIAKFKKFYELLKKYNEIFNLTAIATAHEVIARHFDDSLALGRYLDVSGVHSIADIGSGGGFPGIPLKIVYPHLQIYLIEVAEKKVAYLETIIKELALENSMVVALDWRTFLRTTEYPIGIFCARASLSMDELLRMFKPASPYKESMLVYWASKYWQPGKEEEPYLKDVYHYQIENRERKLVVLQANERKINHG